MVRQSAGPPMDGKRGIGDDQVRLLRPVQMQDLLAGMRQSSTATLPRLNSDSATVQPPAGCCAAMMIFFFIVRPSAERAPARLIPEASRDRRRPCALPREDRLRASAWSVRFPFRASASSCRGPRTSFASRLRRAARAGPVPRSVSGHRSYSSCCFRSFRRRLAAFRRQYSSPLPYLSLCSLSGGKRYRPTGAAPLFDTLTRLSSGRYDRGGGRGTRAGPVSGRC